jgi:hypothetical protein
LTLADEENEMSLGDAVSLPAQAPRLWENRSQEIAEILIVSSRMPSRFRSMTRPDDARQEWAFDLSGAQRSADVADQLRRRFRTGNGRP